MNQNHISEELSTDNPLNQQNDGVINQVLVFQCHKCLSIVGDSTAFICADTQMKTITLKAVSCVSLSCSTKDLETSKDGPSIGSTYSSFRCAHCKIILGRAYKTTASNLDSVRDLFTFDSDMIVTFQIGSYQQIATSISLNPPPVIPTIQDYQRQEAKLLKIEQMMLFFKEHISSLEVKLNDIENKNSKRQKITE